MSEALRCVGSLCGDRRLWRARCLRSRACRRARTDSRENRRRSRVRASWNGAGTQFLPGATAARGGELDIVARDGATLVFVEVKARDGRDVRRRRPRRSPSRKRRRIVADRAATTWRGTVSRDCPCRFDVVSIRCRRRSRRGSRCIQNAFDASASIDSHVMTIVTSA